jgi:hypothetical protein
MHARQPSRYFTLIEDRREVMVTGGVRFDTRLSRSVHLEHVAGVLIVTNRGWHQMEYDPPVSLAHEVGSRETLSSHPRLGVSAGVDVRVGAGRVAVVPSVRVLHVFKDYIGGSAKAWTWSVRPGVALRVYF